MAGYWQQRKGMDYYQIVRQHLEALGPQGSILDVGCLDTPVVTWGDFDQRFTVDPLGRPDLPGVLRIMGYWPDSAAVVPLCDVVMCLQVLEHLDDPQSFCGALFAHARHVVILSVPWGWPAGAEPSHRQDPVDGEKLRAWTGREPTTCVVTPSRRAVATYRM